MLKPFSFSLVVLTVTLIFQPSFANEASHVGRVIAVQGDCTMQVDGKAPVKLSKNDQIIENSTVSTKPNSFIAVELTDKSEVKLGSNSQLKFDYSAKNSEKVDLKLKMGVVKSLVKKRLDSGRWFKIHANAATMGVRGTEFVTSLLPVNGKQMREEVQVIHGTVQVSDRMGKELAMVKAGMGLGLRSMMNGAQGAQIVGQVPQPVRLNPQQIDAIKAEKFLVAPKMLEAMPVKSEVKSEAKADIKSAEHAPPGAAVHAEDHRAPGKPNMQNMSGNMLDKEARFNRREMRRERFERKPHMTAPAGTLPNSVLPVRPPSDQPLAPPPPTTDPVKTDAINAAGTNK